MTHSVVISGKGVWLPEHTISNQELVTALNAWSEKYNQAHAAEIAAGTCEAKLLSDAAFIEKASGIKSRYAFEKKGILDIDRMRPLITERPDSELSQQAEMALNAAKMALKSANKEAADIDVVIVACAYTQRAYPAIAIEVQAALGISGFGFDMLVACSAATFALHRAYEMIATGTARAVLVINPELTSPQVNYTDRDSHFIFGDVATAVVIEAESGATSQHQYQILSTKAETQFSNTIRSNFGYTSRASDAEPYGADKLFHQEGRKVFKDVCPMAIRHLKAHLLRLDLNEASVTRWWLHQANINMNQLIVRKLIGKEPGGEDAPMVLAEFANTASAGSIIAFARHSDDLPSGSIGVICSFGAGYSIGSLIVKKR